STMNAWGDPKFVAAVKTTGRKRLVMCGISTSACLTYPVVSALADGYEVAFIEDAVGDSSRQQHDTAVLRLAHAGAIPNTTVGMIAEWFLDWKLPIANEWRKVAVPYYEEIAALQRAPEFQRPHGFYRYEERVRAQHAEKDRPSFAGEPPRPDHAADE